MEIRKLEENDISNVVELWYETSVQAHHFIPADYWKNNKSAMATTYLPNSETYVAVEEDEIVGFVAMVDDYLAAIFVNPKNQGLGIGQKLMDYVKNARSTIELKVYKQNSDSIRFYQNQGFKIISEHVEENTREMEVVMKWNQA